MHKEPKATPDSATLAAKGGIFAVANPPEPLSLEKCRKILGDQSPESDAELKLLRDSLYGLAHVAVEAFRTEHHLKRSQRVQNATTQPLAGAAKEKLPTINPTAFSEVLASLPEEVRYEIEERAAILENDGGLERSAAERAALSEYRNAQTRKESK